MSLIIRVPKVKAPVGAEKLYRDALVSKGSLLLHDFSNKGTLENFSLALGAPVKDLSREASNPLSVVNSTTFNYNADDVEEPSLTAGKGLSLLNFGANSGGANNYGVDIGTSLLNYLNVNQPRLLFTIWLRVLQDVGGSGGFVTSTSEDGGGNSYPLRVNKVEGGFSINLSMAGAAIGSQSIGENNLAQISCEYQGSGFPLRRFRDGMFQGLAGNAFTFGTPTSPLVFGKTDTINRNIVIYRYLIEDLSVSGRSADDVVQKDWEYCTGTGAFDGSPTKRPFIDNY